MKKFGVGVAVAILVMVSMILSGCETLSGTLKGAKRDVVEFGNVISGIVGSASSTPSPKISLVKIPRAEQAEVFSVIAACESKYTPPPKMDPIRGEYLLSEVTARYEYEVCLQIELNKGLSSDPKYQEKEKSCANLKENRLEECLEGVRIALLSKKGRDIIARRDNAISGQPPVKVVRRDRLNATKSGGKRK